MPYIQSGSMIRNSAMEGASSAVSSSLSPHLSEVSPLQIIALNGQGTHYIITRFILHRISHNKVLIHVSKIFFPIFLMINNVWCPKLQIWVFRCFNFCIFRCSRTHRLISIWLRYSTWLHSFMFKFIPHHS